MKPLVPIYQQDWNFSQVKYFLGRWYEYDQHLNDLSDFDRACVVELYTRLSYLSSSDRQLLADKYHRPKGTRPTDQQQADIVGIPKVKYRKQRFSIELQLQRHREHPADNAKS